MQDFGTFIPAIRGKQGGRVFYVTNLSNKFLRSFLKDVQSAVSPIERSQRPLDPKHAEAITHYIKSNVNEYVIGALTFAMDREGSFVPSSETNSNTFQLGTLKLDTDMEYHSLDGQHRRQALVEAQEELESIGSDTTAVIFYVEPDMPRKQQMFSDMNSTPRKVSKSLNVSYNNRDPFSRAAKILIKEIPYLLNRVEQIQPRVKADSQDFYSLSGIQDATKRVAVGSLPRGLSQSDLSDKAILDQAKEFFQILMEARPEFAAAYDDKEQLIKYREETILFNSTTLRVLAGAVGRANRYYSNQAPQLVHDKLVKAIGKIDFSTKSKIFIDSGFITAGIPTPSARNQEIVAAIIAVYDCLKDSTGVESRKGITRPPKKFVSSPVTIS